MRVPSRPWRQDPDLISAAQAGNEEAVLALLKVAQPDIRRYAARSCRSGDDVDDAVQETLWLLYRRVGTIRALTSVSGWLATRPSIELRLDVARAIRSLPEHYRQVVLLRDIEEMSIDEISGTLGLTRESTKARLHRARNLIREYLVD